MRRPAFVAVVFAAGLFGCIQGVPPLPQVSDQPPGPPVPSLSDGTAKPCPALKTYDKKTLAAFATELAAIEKTAPTVVSFISDYKTVRKECGIE